MDNRCGTKAGYSAHRRRNEKACLSCLDAVNQYNKILVKKYPEKRQNSSLKTVYNITLEQYNEMLEKQNGVCYICEKPEEKKAWQTGAVMRLAVDHDHACCPGVKSCGKCVRGLLCHMCNTIIGKLEQENMLEKIIAYIKKSASPRL